jgi:hypothetical protein
MDDGALFAQVATYRIHRDSDRGDPVAVLAEPPLYLCQGCLAELPIRIDALAEQTP